MEANSLERLHTNQRLFAEELIRRGAQVEIMDVDGELLQVAFNEHVEYVVDRSTRWEPAHLVKITADKFLTKRVLERNGVNVPKGEVFSRLQTQDALEYARILGFPCVVKPNFGSHGDGVYANILSESAFNEAWTTVAFDHELIVVEKTAIGKEYRVFVTSEGACAVLHREPAHVVGDGERSLAGLIHQETLVRERLRGKKLLCPIVTDEIVDGYLREQGMDLSSVPVKGVKTYLRPSSNIAKGGVGHDMTDVAHGSVLDLAKKVLEAFKGLPCIGIDLIIGDIRLPVSDQQYAVLEVNSNPGLAMHMLPGTGSPRDVAAYLFDATFGHIV